MASPRLEDISWGIDAISSFMLRDSAGSDMGVITTAESKGWTVITRADWDGHVVHTLRIDAVGIPATDIHNGYSYNYDLG
jgi:hypothetical protein